MEESILEHLTVAAYAVIFGIMNGVVYDLLTILRCTFCFSSGIPDKPNRIFDREWPLVGKAVRKTKSGRLENLWFFLSDILFWLLLTLGSILFLFFFYDGRFRWFFALGFILGFVLYRISISRIVLLVFRYFLFFLKLFFRYLLHFMQIPIIIISVRLSAVAKRLFRQLRYGFFLVSKRLFLWKATDRAEHRLPDLLHDIK